MASSWASISEGARSRSRRRIWRQTRWRLPLSPAASQAMDWPLMLSCSGGRGDGASMTMRTSSSHQ